MFRIEIPPRWSAGPLVWLVSLLIVGDLAATPPKSTGPGTAVSEREPKDQDSTPRGVSPSAWLDALRRQSVTPEQQDVMTPIVRTFLHRTVVWERDIDPRYRTLLEKYREADAESRPELLIEIRALRAERPQFRPVKDELWRLLDNTQQVRLLQTIRAQRTPSRLTRPSGRKTARPEPGRDAGPAVQPSTRQEGGPAKDAEQPRLWQFAEDENPERHGDPSKPTSKADPTGEAEAVSPEETSERDGDADRSIVNASLAR